jgi:hypothetical protein
VNAKAAQVPAGPERRRLRKRLKELTKFAGAIDDLFNRHKLPNARSGAVAGAGAPPCRDPIRLEYTLKTLCRWPGQPLKRGLPEGLRTDQKVVLALSYSDKPNPGNSEVVLLGLAGYGESEPGDSDVGVLRSPDKTVVDGYYRALGLENEVEDAYFEPDEFDVMWSNKEVLEVDLVCSGDGSAEVRSQYIGGLLLAYVISRVSARKRGAGMRYKYIVSDLAMDDAGVAPLENTAVRFGWSKMNVDFIDENDDSEDPFDEDEIDNPKNYWVSEEGMDYVAGAAAGVFRPLNMDVLCPLTTGRGRVKRCS